MDLRRRMGAILAMAQGGRLPANIAIDEVTLTGSGTEYTLSHSLGKTPHGLMLFPKERPVGTGASNPIALTGFDVGSTGITEYPNKLISNTLNSSGNWDYSASNRGWAATQSNIELKIGNATNNLPSGDYYLITYAYE